MEAEYMALSDACREGIGLRNVLLEIQEIPASNQIILHEDNTSTQTIAKNPQNHNKTKHINIRYHYIREQVAEGTVDIQYCPTGEQIADALTKFLPHKQFAYLRDKMGIKYEG